MTFKEIRDQIQDRLRESLGPAWDKFQESALYTNARERFQNLPPFGQKTVIGALVGTLLLVVLSVPWSYYSESMDNMQSFEDSRGLTRDLFHTARSSNMGPSETMNASTLKDVIKHQLEMDGLADTQVETLTELSAADMKALSLLPPPVHEEGVELKLKKLNVEQVVDIGYQLQSLSRATKMIKLAITASHPNPHYFDVLMDFATFSILSGNTTNSKGTGQ